MPQEIAESESFIGFCESMPFFKSFLTANASATYAGSGVPGSGAGGNGSDGCAFTSGDRVTTGSAINDAFTLTLGSENMSNATGNVVLVRIALNTGQTVSSLSIS